MSSVESALGLAADQVGAVVAALPEDQWFDRKSVLTKPRELRAVRGPSDGSVALRRLRALEQAGLVHWSGKSQRDPRAVWNLAGP